MRASPLPRRFGSLPVAEWRGIVVPLAQGRVRLLGLAGLDLEQAGPGLLIPRCSSVHTFGMRFALDLAFLDRDGRLLSARLGVGPRRLAARRGAAAVLELPAGGLAELGLVAASGNFADRGGESGGAPAG
jgi:hypothetical protein